jgi:hypothetical protein
VKKSPVVCEIAERAAAQTSVDQATKIGPCGSVVEHSLGKGEVARSIRAMGTKFFSTVNLDR